MNEGITRREALTVIASTIAAVGAGYALRELQAQADIPQSNIPGPEVAPQLEVKKWPLEQYMEYVWDTGEVDQYGWHITNEPVVSPVIEFRPINSVVRGMGKEFPNGYNNGKIVLRNSTKAPDVEMEAEGDAFHYNSSLPYQYESIKGWNDSVWLHKIELYPSEIKAKYIVPVFGDSLDLRDYTGEENKDRVFDVNGQVLWGGIWLALSDEHGKYVHPDGTLLTEKERPYFVSDGFVVFYTDQRPDISPASSTSSTK